MLDARPTTICACSLSHTTAGKLLVEAPWLTALRRWSKGRWSIDFTKKKCCIVSSRPSLRLLTSVASQQHPLLWHCSWLMPT